MTTMSSARERANRGFAQPAPTPSLTITRSTRTSIVVLALVEQDVLVERPELAVDPGPRKSSSSQGGKVLLELASSPAHDRRHDVNALIGVREDDVYDAIKGL